MPVLSNVAPILTSHLNSKTGKTRARLLAQLARKEVAGQIRQLREKRGLTQAQFAKICKMKQSAVSRIEQAEYSGWTYKTLARVAEKLDARLRISFEPIEELTPPAASRVASDEGRTRRSSAARRERRRVAAG